MTSKRRGEFCQFVSSEVPPSTTNFNQSYHLYVEHSHQNIELLFATRKTHVLLETITTQPQSLQLIHFIN